MKIRKAFVSNSSSTCYILDLRKDAVKEFVTRCGEVPAPEPLTRCTAFALGEKAVRYAEEWNEDVSRWMDERWLATGLGNWILEWAEKLGVENTVFVRESDEGMGGDLPAPYGRYEENRIVELAEAAMEYH